jgi:hypothetical protein
MNHDLAKELKRPGFPTSKTYNIAKGANLSLPTGLCVFTLSATRRTLKTGSFPRSKNS